MLISNTTSLRVHFVPHSFTAVDTIFFISVLTESMCIVVQFMSLRVNMEGTVMHVAQSVTQDQVSEFVFLFIVPLISSVERCPGVCLITADNASCLRCFLHVSGYVIVASVFWSVLRNSSPNSSMGWQFALLLQCFLFILQSVAMSLDSFKRGRALGLIGRL